MPEPKAQLIDPQGPIDVPGLSVTGVTTATGGFVGQVQGAATGLASTTTNLSVGIITATKFQGNTTGNVSGLADGTNINVGIITSTSFTGDLVGNAAGLSTTTANIKAGIMSATSFAGNFTGVASGITGTPNIVVGIMTGTLKGDGSTLTGIAATNWITNNVTANSGTTAIDLSDGNVVKFTQTSNTTVSFANTGTSNIVSFIRPGANYTLTWPSAIKWDSGSAPTLNTTSGENEVFTLLTRDEGVTWYGWETVNQEFAVKKQLWTWGGNNDGRLGQNSLTQYSSPVQVGSDESWSGVSKTGGDGTTAAVKNGQLFMWGGAASGSSGLNSNIKYSSPVQVPGTNWSNWVSSVKGITIATKTDGTLWTWGKNEYGQLGQNSVVLRSSPVQIPGTTWATEDGKCVAGHTNAYAIKTDGTLWGWGMNERGSIGDSTKTYRSSPTQIPGTSWLYVPAGFSNVLATKTDGTMWGWGLNGDGELGLNNLTQYSSPKQIPGTTWHRPDAHSTANLATKTDGTLWSMGYNMPGMIGGDRIYRSSPTQIPGTTWDKDKAIMGGGSIGALKTDGTMWIWGRNFRGELGQSQSYSSAPYRSSPVQVPGTWSSIGGLGGYYVLGLR